MRHAFFASAIVSAAICRAHRHRKTFAKLAQKNSKSKPFQSIDLLWPSLDRLQIDFYGAAVF
jgi:hypothetical protein